MKIFIFYSCENTQGHVESIDKPYNINDLYFICQCGSKCYVVLIETCNYSSMNSYTNLPVGLPICLKAHPNAPNLVLVGDV